MGGSRNDRFMQRKPVDTDIQVSGNLNAVGDPIDGTFNTQTKTFTAATESAGAGTGV